MVREEGRTDADQQLYGLNHTNCDNGILSKNIFTDYLPVSVAIYMDDGRMPLNYIKVGDPDTGQMDLSEEPSGLIFEEINFSDLLDTDQDLGDLNWKHEAHHEDFNSSFRAPGIDLVVEENGNDLIELEAKLTVTPHHRDDIATEMIVRQNTEFCLAERIVYYYGEKLSQNVDLDELEELVTSEDVEQHPFILHGIWKTEDRSPMLDINETIDVFVISDMAYLKMLFDSNLERGGARTRIGRVLDLIVEWINQYKQNGRMEYLREDQGSRDHLKVTLYPEKYKIGLEKKYRHPRLSLDDILEIVPEDSIEELSPERRLDNSLVYASEVHRLEQLIKQGEKGGIDD
jgi:hypothetical protein